MICENEIKGWREGKMGTGEGSCYFMTTRSKWQGSLRRYRKKKGEAVKKEGEESKMGTV